MKHKMGFQTRLAVSLSIVVLLGLAGSGFVSYHLASNLLRDNVVGGLQAQIREVETLIAVTQKENLDRLGLLMTGWHPVIEKSVRIDAGKALPREIEDQVSHEKLTVNVPALFIDGKPDASHAFVDGIAHDAGVASTLFVRVPEGFVRVSTSVHRKDGSRAVGTFIPGDSPVARALSEGRRFNARAQVVGDWYSTAYEPLRQDGRVVGAFFLGLPDTSTDSIRHHLKGKKLFETGYYFILDGLGKMVLHPTLEGTNVLEQTSADGQKIFREILDRKSGTLEYRWDNAQTGERQTKLAPFHHLPAVDWYVAASINQAEALAPLKELKWILLTVSGAVSLLAMGAALWFGRSVALRLTAVSDQIENAFRHVDESADRFVAQSESLAEASTQQAAGLQETVSAVEEIRATVQKNLDQARAAAAGAVETDAKARHGSEVLEALAASVEQIAGGNREMRDMIGKNDERMKRIFDVFAGVETKTQLINEIVFQTKLLSFNASVEAARAGEHGKGFSVVAEEIGRLAAQSGQAAEEIRATLENSHAEVEGLISENRSSLHTLIDQSSARVETGVRTAEDARRTFREIIDRIGDANASVQEISRASNEQTQGVHEIARAMQEIDKATQQNSVSAVQIKEMSGRLSEDSRSAGGAVAQLREFLRGSKAPRSREDARVIHFPETKRKAA